MEQQIKSRQLFELLSRKSNKDYSTNSVVGMVHTKRGLDYFYDLCCYYYATNYDFKYPKRGTKYPLIVAVNKIEGGVSVTTEECRIKTDNSEK